MADRMGLGRRHRQRGVDRHGGAPVARNEKCGAHDQRADRASDGRGIPRRRIDLLDVRRRDSSIPGSG